MLTAVVLLTACTDKSAHITMTLADETDATGTLLNQSADGDTVMTFAVNGSTINITVPDVTEPYIGRINIPGTGRLDLVVEPGNISIDSEGIVSGTPLNDEFSALHSRLATLESEEDLVAELDKAYQANKDNVIGKWAFGYRLLYSNATLEQAQAALASAPADYATTPRIAGYLADLKAAAATAVGSTFTDFAITRGDTTEYLSDHVGRDGKFTLVDFWASWCGPCRMEMPNLKAILAKYPTRLQIVGVAVWDEPSETLKAIKELELPWHVMMGDKALKEPTDKYGINGIPHIMLISPEGVILSRGLQGEELAAEVDNQINNYGK